MYFVGTQCLYEPIFCTTNLVSVNECAMKSEVHIMNRDTIFSCLGNLTNSLPSCIQFLSKMMCGTQ